MRNVLLAASCLAALPTLAFAATDVDEVIVTATRLPSTPQDIPGVRVVDEAEIDARQATFAIDALETVPGVSVFRNGGAGAVTSIRLRGAESDKALIIIDGVPVNDPSMPDGGYDLSTLDVADVERIEVLAGPQGSIWGSDAIGGVVAFTTRELDGWRAQAEFGGHDTLRGSAAWGMASEDHAVGASIAAFSTDGVSAAAAGTEDDGFDLWTVSANGRRTFGAVQIDGRLRYAESEVEQDGVVCVLDCFDPDWMNDVYALTDTDSWYETQAWSGFIRGQANAFGLTHTASLSAYDIERASHSAFSSSFESDRRIWRWETAGGRPADPFAFVVGAEREEISAVLSEGEADQGATSVFGVLRWRPVEQLSLNGSLRHDSPDEYEGETTARVSAAYELGWGFTASAAWGQGFKTPTISHTVCDFCFPIGPSTDLTPERAEGWDLRLAWESEDGRFSGDVTGYRLNVEDQIAYTGRYVNLEKTRTDGIEAEAQAQLTDSLDLRVTYAWTDAIDETTGLELYRAPEHSGSVSVGWEQGPAQALLTIRAESDQADIEPATFSRDERGGFVTADLAGSYEIAEGVELTGRVENLNDEEFQEVLGYGEPGRTAFVGIRFRN